MLLCAAVLTSCNEEMPAVGHGPVEKEGIVVKMGLSCELLECETDDSKSLHDASSLKKITNANYYLFENGSLVRQGYFEDAGEFAVSLPSYNRKYNLYVLANVGRKTVEGDIMEADMAAAVHHDYLNRENYFKTMNEWGFPMSVTVEDFSAYNTEDLKLRRLVHTLYVTVNTEALNSTDMEFTGLSVRNAARDIYPFAAESKAEYVIDGDAADVAADDLETLNNGDRVTLYLLENARGELFPGNEDWKRKVPEMMDAAEEDRMKCSYIELTASARTATSYYGRNVYRAYLGTGPSDCNVRRHTYSAISNRFTNEMIVDEEWRIESDVPVIKEVLTFVEKIGGTGGLSSSKLYPGFRRDFYIYRSNKDIEYTLKGPDASRPPYLNYTVTRVDDHYDKVSVTTDAEWNDSGSRTAWGTFEVCSKDGLISNSLNCAVLIDPIEITFSYGPNQNADGYYPTDKPKLRISVTNHLNLGFEADITGNCGAYIFYYPNGTWGKKVEDFFERTFEMGTVERIYPKIGNTSVIDAYLNSTTFINNAGSGLYDMFSYDIWRFTKEDSYNKIGSSNSYMKHYQPVALTLNINLSYGASEDGLLYPENGLVTLPVIVTNDDTTVISADAMGYMAGTDFGIYWNQIDDAAVGSVRRISYTSLYSPETAGAIQVYVNGSRKWSGGLSIPQ